MDTGFISTCPLVKYLQCSTLIIEILSNFTNCKNKKLIIFLLYDLLKTSEEIRIWQKDLPRLNANIAHDDRWDTPFGAVSCYKYHMLGLLWQYWQEWVSTCIFKSSQYWKSWLSHDYVPWVSFGKYGKNIHSLRQGKFDHNNTKCT